MLLLTSGVASSETAVPVQTTAPVEGIRAVPMPTVGSTGRCGVHVRVLKGWSKAKQKQASGAGDSATEVAAADVEQAKIADLSSQLETLPFARYETVSEEQQLISFKEKGVFNLKVNETEQQILFVEPEGVRGGSVGVIVDWRSETGDELLSSKLKVGNGQNVVFGTDVSEVASLILCIKVTCE